MSMTITLSPEARFANYKEASGVLDQIVTSALSGGNALDPLSVELIRCANKAQLEMVDLRTARSSPQRIAAAVAQHLQELRTRCVGLDGAHPLKEDPVIDCGAIWERSEHTRYRLLLGTFDGQHLSDNPPVHRLAQQVLCWLHRCAHFEQVVSIATEETSRVPVHPVMEKMTCQLIERNVLLARRNQSLQRNVNRMGERFIQVMDGQHALSASALQSAESSIQENERMIQQRIASLEQINGAVIADLTARIDATQKAYDMQRAEWQKTTSTLSEANKEAENRWQSQIAQLRIERETVVSGLRAQIDEQRRHHEQSEAVLSLQVQAIAVSSSAMLAATARASDARIAGLAKQIEERPPLPEELQLQVHQAQLQIQQLQQENQQIKARCLETERREKGHLLENALNKRRIEELEDDEGFCVIQ